MNPPHCIRIQTNITNRREVQTVPATLKFGPNKFTDIIWGSPVEIEMDYQALQDVTTQHCGHLAHPRQNQCSHRWYQPDA
jgi:hypothetical protein